MTVSKQGEHAIETMQVEVRRYPPDPEFSTRANAQPDIYEKGFDEFWSDEATKRVTWFEPWQQLYEWKPPYAKWFIGAKLNVCYNCVDRHVEGGQGDKVAYFWEGEPEDDRRQITFRELQRDVVRFANALKKVGVKKGTHIAIYMGMVPELPVAMLACTRLGAPFTVVFGGFSGEALSDRMNDMECEVMITQDEGWRRGNRVPLKANADAGMDSRAGRHNEREQNFVGARRVGDANLHCVKVTAYIRSIDVGNRHVKPGAGAANFFGGCDNRFRAAEHFPHRVASRNMPESAVFNLAS